MSMNVSFTTVMAKQKNNSNVMISLQKLFSFGVGRLTLAGSIMSDLV